MKVFIILFILRGLSSGSLELKPQELEYGHRVVWGDDWQRQMQLYEESILHDKSQTYYNTPVIDYEAQKSSSPKEEQPQFQTQPKAK